ncbi:NUDIX domain-containing protein [Streptomyces sp. NPDC006552]|uniref:NUDIX hydrolase n=1 Tax=Streptomyces sp. NPDC006552 TaxID=3157179 RepID=UPI0033B1CD40
MHETTAQEAHAEPAEADLVLRPTVRVLLLDEADRLLLFSSQDESDGHTFWYPVGGGVEQGESYEEAGAREVAEETGLTGLVLATEVWRRRKTGVMGGVAYLFHERYYLARVPAFDISTDGFTENERSSIVSHRWWSPAELAATADRLVPDDLYPRLVDLLTDGAPAEPIDLAP